MSIRIARLSLPLLLATTALVAPFAAPAWAKVGVTSTASGGPIGQPPQQPQHVLTVGVDVFANERITTGANDQAHLLFLDGSALTIGPNSDVVLDKFVYDPDKETGQLSLSVGKGVFRLVGGKITKNDGAATVRVGSATIGIRGGIVIVDAQKQEALDTYFMFGDKLVVSTPLGTETALRPGSAITTKRGQPPSSARLVGPDALTGLLAQLEGRVGGGGARISTVTNGAINTGVSNFSKTNDTDDTKTGKNTSGDNSVNSITVVTDNTLTPPTGTVADGRLMRQQPYTSFDPVTLAAPRDANNNALIAAASVSGGTLTIGATNGATVTLPFQPGTVNVTSANSSGTYGPLSGTGYIAPDSSFYIYALGEVNNGFNRLSIVGGTPTATANFPISGFGQHTMLSIGGAPFLPDNVTNSAVANAYYSPLYSVYSPNITTANAQLSPQRAVWFQASLGFSGSGATQSSFFSLAVGGYFTDASKNNTLYAAGSFQAYLRNSGSTASEAFRGSLSTIDTTHGTAIYGLMGQNMAFGPEAVNWESGSTVRTPQAALDQPLSSPTGSDYYFVTAAVDGITTSTTPNTRNGGTFNGYAAGLSDTRTASNQITTTVLANEDPTKLTITTSPTTNRVAATFDLHDTQTTGGTTLRFGSTSGTYGQASAYVDDKTFAAVQSPVTASTYNDGSSTSAIVGNIAMVSGGAVSNPLFAAAGVTPCTCAYLSWGYWAADLTYTSGARAGEQDRVPIGTWVAGTLPGTNEIPTGNISATYTGHMMGTVSNNGSNYFAVGDYTQQWNFASRSGTATINNFDGASFSNVGLSATPSNPRDFFGGGSGTQSRTISINGSFFKGGGDPVAAVGGNFRIGGSNYLAVGSFAASK